MVQFPGSTDELSNRGRRLGPEGSPILLWRCPQCAGELTFASDDRVTCVACATVYPAVDGIPDLRLRRSSDAEPPDLADARALVSEFGESGPEGMITGLFARRAWDAAAKALRVRQTLASPNKLRPELEGWLGCCLVSDGFLLDVGCGAGGLLAAVAQMGYAGAGIDASMPLLVAAKRMIEAHGGTATLACAFAE